MVYPINCTIMKKKRINKFAYPVEVEAQPLCPEFPSSSEIVVAPEIDPIQLLRVEVVPGKSHKVPADFLGLDGEEDKVIVEPATVRYVSDVKLIIHQKDLAKRAGADVAQRFLSSVAPASVFQQQLDKLSDKELLDCVRSRHIQSASEIKDYSEMLMEQAEALRKTAEKQIADAQQAAAEKAAADAASSASNTATPAAAAGVASE